MNFLRNLFKEDSILSEDDEREFLTLFNGLDTFGGEGTKWFDLIKSLPTDAEDMIKMEMSCIILLDKPTSVLFSGLTSAEKKIVKLKEKEIIGDPIKDLQDTLEVLKERFDNCNTEKERESFAEVIKTKESKLLELEVDLSMSKLKDQKKDKSGLHETDEEVDLKDKGMKVRLNTQIALYLPKLSSSELASLKPDSLKAMKEARNYWHEDFKTVNVSKARRIALLSLHFRNNLTKIHKDWIKKYGGRPLKCKAPSKMNNQSKKIFDDMIRDFIDAKDYWNTEDVRSRFNVS
jgi:hypothetical protein